MDPFGAFGEPGAVEVDVITDAYRVSGIVQTRFRRVTDILNQLAGGHLSIEGATVTEHADPGAAISAPVATIDTASILVLAAPGLAGGVSEEMRIPKRAVKASLALPPLLITGTIHVPMGSRPLDGLLNVTDQFLAMTDVAISSAAHPDLGHDEEAVAIARARAQIILISDDERPDELLADVLDERTAEAWLRPEDEA
jgi:hypothetical protein